MKKSNIRKLFVASLILLSTNLYSSNRSNAQINYNPNEASDPYSITTILNKYLGEYCIPNETNCGSEFEAKYDETSSSCVCRNDEHLRYDAKQRKCIPTCKPGYYITEVPKCGPGSFKFKVKLKTGIQEW